MKHIGNILLWLTAVTIIGYLLEIPHVNAQSAHVIALSPEDATEAAKIDADQKALAERSEKFRNHVVRDYLTTKDENRGSGIYLDPEQSGGGLVSFSSGIVSTGSLIWTHEDGSQFYCTDKDGAIHVCHHPEKLATAAEIAKHKSDEAAADLQRKVEAAKEKENARYYRKGWNAGMYDYSEDFKFIVPDKGGGTSTSGLIANGCCATFANGGVSCPMGNISN